MKSSQNNQSEWQGDLNDDCFKKWNGLYLRAEMMDGGDWWWAVSNFSTGNEIESSNDDSYRVESGVRARELAEQAAKSYFKKNGNTLDQLFSQG